MNSISRLYSNFSFKIKKTGRILPYAYVSGKPCWH